MGDVVPLGASAAAGALTPSMSHPSLASVPMGGDASVVIGRTTGGRFMVSSPDAPGWSAAVSDRLTLLRAVDEGFREAAIAAYARAREQPYDVELHDRAADEAALASRVLPFDQDARDAMLGSLACSVTPTTVSTRQSPSDVHNPLAWTPLADGSWLAPGGKKWGGGTQAVQRVIAKRQAMGIDTH